ncbi:hypothetical protein Peur_029465 [Populus x canadensis]
MEGTKVQNIDCMRTPSSKSRVSIPKSSLSQNQQRRLDHCLSSGERDGVARYREFVLEEYMNNFFSNAHDGKKSLDAIISLIQAYV